MIFDDHFEELASWLTAAGLAGEPEVALVTGFCDRVVALGLPQVLIDTLHPIHEGPLFRWSHDSDEPVLLEYGRTGQVGVPGAAASAPQQAEATEDGAKVRSIECCKPESRCCGVACRLTQRPNFRSCPTCGRLE